MECIPRQGSINCLCKPSHASYYRPVGLTSAEKAIAGPYSACGKEYIGGGDM